MDDIESIKARIDTLERYAMEEKKYLLTRLIELESRHDPPPQPKREESCTT